MSTTPARLGKYLVRGVLGRGGMGAVYDAWDPELERPVAIKLLTFVRDDAEQRFRREARLAAGLRHPNIVTVHDFGTDNGVPFIVTELLVGTTVAADIARRVDRPAAFKVRAMADVCLALDCVHRAGAVHRDVKPANIHLGDDGVTRVLDFGVARLLGSSLTQPLDLIGTPTYLPPEVAAGEPVDQRADVFSAAATLYEWLTFRKPREAEDPRALLGRILHEEIPPLREAWPDCPPALARAVERGLDRDPDRRPRTALAFREALLEAVDGAPAAIAGTAVPGLPKGQRPSGAPLPKATRKARGWRLLAAAALLLMGMLAGVVAMGGWPGGLGRPSRAAAAASGANKGSVQPPSPASRRSAVPPSLPEPVSPGSPRKPTPRASVSVPPPGPDVAQVPHAARESTSAAADAPALELVTIPIGTTLLVRIVTELRSDRSRVGDVFFGELQEPLVRDGDPVVPAGAIVRGRIDEIGAPAPGTGPSLAVSLVDLAVDGDTLPIRTTRYLVRAPEARGDQRVSVLIVGAAAGALLGGAVGGGEGALAGAAAGAAVTGIAGAERKSAVVVLGDRIPFRLARAVVLTPRR